MTHKIIVFLIMLFTFQNCTSTESSKPPVFNFLENYPKKDKYFVRLKPWDWLNEKEIYVMTKINDKPSMVTYDFWSQEIYLDATGQTTVSELVTTACKQYTDSGMEIPANIDKILIETLESLVNDDKVIAFKDKKTSLDSIVDKPVSKQ